jgi:hypothetical protein
VGACTGRGAKGLAMSKLLTLAEAAVMLNGKLSARSLRRMAHQGKLHLIRIAGKDFTTEEFLNAMVAVATVTTVSSSVCLDADCQPDCTSAEAATTDPACGSFSTERKKLAQAQALMIAQELKKPSKRISQKTTGRRVVPIGQNNCSSRR